VVTHPREGDLNLLSGTILSSAFLGSMVRYRVSGPGGKALVIEVHDPDEGNILEDGESLRYQLPTDRSLVIGE
jgi:hypothetical protein